MTCFDCGTDIQSYPCPCGYQPKGLGVQKKPPKWLIQYCTMPTCETAIRVPIAMPLTKPICKWCDQGISRAVSPRSWPAGMPDPELPWPWIRDDEREIKLRIPFWKERLRQHGEIYKAWFRT